jgi:hypothetical protein
MAHDLHYLSAEILRGDQADESYETSKNFG